MKIYNPVFLFFIFAVCVAQFAADIYAPSLPAIAKHMNINISYVQASMSIYMFGLAFTQLIYGPMSEGIGRKKPMVFGLFLMTIGGIISMLANNIEDLMIGRFIQGCGGGACAALWRAVFRDIFTGEELSKYASYLVIFIMFIVPSAPLIGGYLEDSFGWRASFIFMAVYSFIGAVGMMLTFKETNKHSDKSKLSLSFVKQQYMTLLKSPVFMGITCGTFLSYGAFFAWFVAGPVLLIDILGNSPLEFGIFTFFGGGAAYASAGFLNGRLVKKLGIKTMLRTGWSIMIIAGILMSLGYVIYGIEKWAICIPALLFYFGCTFIWPNAVAIAFTPFGHIAGYAASLYGFMQICGGAAIAGVIAYMPDNNQLPLGMVMIAASCLAWFVFELSNRSRV